MKNAQHLLLARAQVEIESLHSKQIKQEGLLDALMEGIQILDFDWRYVYVNQALVNYQHTTKEKLIGESILDRFPGIEHTEVFPFLQKCMRERKAQQAEFPFVYPDRSKKWFEMNVSPIEEGILILSHDITLRKEAEEKMQRAQHLYVFQGQINQNIAWIKNEATLYANACRLAVQFGKLNKAWIGHVDFSNQEVHFVEQFGIPAEDLPSFQHIPYEMHGPIAHILQTGRYFVSNDVSSDAQLIEWKPFAQRHGIGSCMVVPIRRSADVIQIFNLYATEKDFWEKEEIDLIEQVAENISFALEQIEGVKKQKAAEEGLAKSERRLRHTMDHMMEGVQLIGFDWKYIYVNDALSEYSTYSKEELEGHSILEKYPGVEHTSLFKTLEKCMIQREPTRLETEFAFPNGVKRHFNLSIQPVPEGIFILSVDVTERKKIESDLLKMNRLYAFNSAINQCIVHTEEEQELLDKACQIATDIGGFAMAWIGLLDSAYQLQIKSVNGDKGVIQSREDKNGLDYTDAHLLLTPTGKAISTGRYAVSNSVLNDPFLAPWKEEFEDNAIQSTISLPLLVGGEAIGVVGFHSKIEHFFDKQEIGLLEEAAGDLSFALQMFENAKKHRQTEALVEQNERRFRALIEKSVDIKTLSSPEGNFLYASPAVKLVLGYTQKEFLKQSIANMIHPDDILGYIGKRMEMLHELGAYFNCQIRLRHKEGHWVWVEGTVTNLLEEPAVQAILSNFRDVSERKQAALQQEFDRNNLNALINNTQDLMWSLGKDMKLITFNIPFGKAIHSLSGKSVQEGDDVLSLDFSEEQIAKYRALYERSFAGETFSILEHLQFPAESWWEISFSPIRKGEEVIGTACYSRNVTKNKRFEQQLKASEAFNKAILSSLDSHIAVIDHTGIIVAVNEAWRRFRLENGKTRMERSETGANYFDICEKAGQEGDTAALKVLKGMKEVLDEQRSMFHYEYEGDSSERRQWFSVRVGKFSSDDRMLVVAYQDITERKLVEEKLIRQNEELEKANGELDRFVYSASHDLRSPLTSILGLVYLMEQKSKEADTLQFAGMIRMSIQRLDGFIKDILSYSQNNRSALEIVEIPLGQKVIELVETLRHVHDAGDIRFEVDIQETVPFSSDFQRFTIVMTNLLSNAIRFHKDPGEARYVKVKGTVYPEYLQLQVEDNGIGIPAKYHTKIFDMFFRLASKVAGPGIGLYIVKETVEKLQGSIRVDSQEGVGTCFTIRLKNF